MTTPLFWSGHGPPPTGRDATIHALHHGAVLVLPATEDSRAFAATTRRLIRAALGVSPDLPWSAVQSIEAPYERLHAVRQSLGGSPDLRAAMARLAESVGFSAADLVDAPRLRSISSGAELDPRAAPVYLLHRDTWYGCPDALLVAWCPLQDTPARDMFAFYPRWFDKAVPNTSAVHDHHRWMNEVGWHGQAPLERYAAPLGPMPDDAVVFDVPEAAVVLFSAAQLHQTRPIPVAPWTRYSVDFRLLPDPTTSSTRAPAVDNHSTGAQARITHEFDTIQAVRSRAAGVAPAPMG